ncbi:MAG: hypothetical protein V1489_01050 [Candidatus Liptonbacteria bacterium]
MSKRYTANKEGSMNKLVSLGLGLLFAGMFAYSVNFAELLANPEKFLREEAIFENGIVMCRKDLLKKGSIYLVAAYPLPEPLEKDGSLSDTQLVVVKMDCKGRENCTKEENKPGVGDIVDVNAKVLPVPGKEDGQTVFLLASSIERKGTGEVPMSAFEAERCKRMIAAVQRRMIADKLAYGGLGLLSALIGYEMLPASPYR